MPVTCLSRSVRAHRHTDAHRCHQSAVLSAHMVSPPDCIPAHGSVAGVDRESTTLICSYLASVFRSYTMVKLVALGKCPKSLVQCSEEKQDRVACDMAQMGQAFQHDAAAAHAFVPYFSRDQSGSLEQSRI